MYHLSPESGIFIYAENYIGKFQNKQQISLNFEFIKESNLKIGTKKILCVILNHLPKVCQYLFLLYQFSVSSVQAVHINVTSSSHFQSRSINYEHLHMFCTSIQFHPCLSTVRQSSAT